MTVDEKITRLQESAMQEASVVASYNSTYPVFDCIIRQWIQLSYIAA